MTRTLTSFLTPDLLYHYTPLQNLAEIADTGRINLSVYDLPEPRLHAAWFSANTVYESTSCGLARKGKGVRMINLPATKFGYARIGVDTAVAPHTFDAYCRDRQVPAELRTRLLDKAAEVDADPDDWFCTYQPVPHTEWRTVEVLWNYQWVDMATAAQCGLVKTISRCIDLWHSGKDVAIVTPEVAAELGLIGGAA